MCKDKIIVFGMGKYFEHKRESIFENYDVIYFVDNKVGVNETRYFENTSIKIVNPLNIDKNSTVPIFMMSVYFVSMWKQLISIGISSDRVVFPYFIKPYFESDDAVDCYVNKILFNESDFICVTGNGDKVKITEKEEWRAFLRRAYRDRYPLINAISSMYDEPISEQFGTERGEPIDRYYVDKFLSNNSNYIQGDVLEIEDNTYTNKFSGGNVKNSFVMDVSSTADNVTFCANLETGDGIRNNIADCFILTQTLMYIFDLKTAAKNIGRLLKKNGVALITCSGLSQNSRRCMDNYGCYFNFNKDVFVRMFEDEKNLEVIDVGSYGNVKTVSAHINGLCCEDLSERAFEHNDKYYPLIVYAVVKKNG